MKHRWLTVLLCFVAWRTACEAVSQREVYSSTTNSSAFCITVSDREPANLTRAERLNWKSNPTITVQLFVRVTRLNQYTTCASKHQLVKDLLHLGSHNVEYREDVMKGFMTLALTVDGTAMEPQNCSEQVYASTAHFDHIRVLAKGPLTFNWDETCPETTRGPSILPSTTTTKLSDPPPPGRNTRDASTLISSTLLLTTYTMLRTSSTPNPFSVTSTPSAPKGISFWTWIIAGAVLVAVIVIAVSCCYAFARRRNHKKQMKRRTDAERVKQELLVDAKRLSYHEQMRWDSTRVDSAAVPATQEFSYNMTTFSDQG